MLGSTSLSERLISSLGSLRMHLVMYLLTCLINLLSLVYILGKVIVVVGAGS